VTLRANVALAALAAFAAFAFFLLLGGTWFAYYVRQEGVQTTHFILIGLAIAAALVVNLPLG